MVAILLAVLGVPLWLVVGMVLGAPLYGRPRFKQARSLFGCKVRLVTATMGSLKDTWDGHPPTGGGCMTYRRRRRRAAGRQPLTWRRSAHLDAVRNQPAQARPPTGG
jgi:hypothetical protein